MAHTDRHRERLKRNFRELVSHLTAIEEICDILFSEQALSYGNKEDILNRRTESDKNRRLVEIIANSSVHSYRVFLSALEQTQQHHLKASLDVKQLDTAPVLALPRLPSITHNWWYLMCLCLFTVVIIFTSSRGVLSHSSTPKDRNEAGLLTSLITSPAQCPTYRIITLPPITVPFPLVVTYRKESSVVLDGERLIRVVSCGLEDFVAVKVIGRSRFFDLHRYNGQLIRKIMETKMENCDIACRGGYIYVTDTVSGNIHVYDKQTGCKTNVLRLYTKGLYGIAATAKFLFVTSEFDDRVYKLDLTTDHFDQQVFATGLEGPLFISASESMVVVSSTRSHTVRVFNSDGSLRFTYGGMKGGGDNHLNNPHGVCFDKTGNIVIADWANYRLVLLSPTGGLLGHVKVGRPLGVMIANDGNLYVMRGHGSELAVFTYDYNNEQSNS